MSVIDCPNCQKPIQLTDLRPGRFIPKCPNCGIDFELTVPEDVGQPPVVAKREDARASTTDFVLLSLPESDSEAPAVGVGSIVRDTLDRLISRLGQLRFARLPRGIPRLLDEGHYWILRQETQSLYGPMFVAIPWCGGALRTIWMLPPDLGRDPYYASRWIGEMIVAAELIHPNLEPFEATGESRGLFQSKQNTPLNGRGLFYAVKSRDEGTPAAVVTRAAKSPAIRRATAAAIMLQVARGLKFAHDQGITHRDLRPENVIVDPQGYVRIINFGLDSHAFLNDAERQRQLAVIADKKVVKSGQAPLPPINRPDELEADLSALGRTWLTLALDQPNLMTLPGGTLATRTESMHPSDSEIPRKLVSGTPGDRFAHMGEVVQALESALGIWSPAALGERETLQNQIVETGNQLGGASNLVLRGFILRIAAGLWSSLLLLCVLAGLWKLGLNFLLLGTMTAAWIAAIADPSRQRRSSLIKLLGDSLRGTSFALLATISLLVMVLLGAGLISGYLWTCVFFAVLSFGLAMGLEIGVGRAAAAEWRAASLPLAKLVANLRLSGLRDSTLREWFDSAKVADARVLRRSLFSAAEARDVEGNEVSVKRGPAWAAGLVAIQDTARRYLVERTLVHRDQRHRALLTRVETDRLEARGVNRLTAIRRARRVGKAVISVIADWRLTRIWDSATSISLRADLKKTLRDNVWQAVEDPEQMLVEHERHPNRLVRQASSLVQTALGRLVRLAVGSALLVLFAVWLDREGIVTRSHVVQASSDASKAVSRAIEHQDVGELREIHVPVPSDHKRLWESWNEPIIHREWSRSLSGINLGLAGLILVISAFFQRFLVGVFAILGALVILVGPVLAGAELGDALTRNTTAVWDIAGLIVAALGFLIRPRRQVI